jgi:hypothetical protein
MSSLIAYQWDRRLAGPEWIDVLRTGETPVPLVFGVGETILVVGQVANLPRQDGILPHKTLPTASAAIPELRIIPETDAPGAPSP